MIYRFLFRDDYELNSFLFFLSDNYSIENEENLVVSICIRQFFEIWVVFLNSFRRKSVYAIMVLPVPGSLSIEDQQPFVYTLYMY